MADISKGYDFVPGEQVTDVKLDNLGDQSIILPAFVTAKTELLVPTGTEYFNVIDSTGGFKKVKLLNIPGATTQPNPVYTVLPDGATITQVCAANKVYQNARVTLGGNRNLVINGMTNGMFGVIIVSQPAGGNCSLNLPALSIGLGQTGFITQADLTMTPGARTICSWTYDGVYIHWTFAKYVVATPFCRAYMTTQVLTTGVAADVLYTAESHDNDTMHDAGINPGRITIQRPGIYLASAWVVFTSSPTGSRSVSINYNATPIAAQKKLASGSSDTTLSAFYPAAAGDYFTVQAFQDSGGNLNVANSTFEVSRVGAV